VKKEIPKTRFNPLC